MWKLNWFRNNRLFNHLLFVLFLLGLILFVLGVVFEPNVTRFLRVTIIFTFIFFLAILYLFKEKIKSIWNAINIYLEQHTDTLDNISDKNIQWWIFLASALGLFAELMVIRWHASAFQLFGYFKNISLLSCFLGLGIGYSMARRKSLSILLVLPALSIQFIGMLLLRYTQLQTALQSPISEQLTLGLAQATSFNRTLMVYGFLIMVVIFNMLTFIPFGHLVSRLMLRKPKLVAYSWNLAGSLTGILLFSLIAFFWSPPAIWFLLTAFGVYPFIFKARKLLWLSVVSAFLAVAVFSIPFYTDRIDVYSPYQLITVHLERNAPPVLQVNNVFYQRIIDLRRDSSQRVDNKKFDSQINYYDLPYLIKSEPEKVLIVGSGTGNDVAAALRGNADRIDAVEIDPVILRYGEKFHPEKPYQDERVRTILDDARHFIRKSTDKYDLIVYGLLDSHTLLSGKSSVRLDSFVYTVEGFNEAKNLLTDKGMIALSFSVLSEELGKKLFLMLQAAFDGQDPVIYKTEVGGGALLYIIGPGVPSSLDNINTPLENVTDKYKNPEIVTDISTDDWPFFYMPVRKYPVSSIMIVILLLFISLLSIRQYLPKLNASSFSITAFFLGAGFMLVETKNITELSLAFGNTWLVISAVITGILTMAFLANLIIMKWGTPRSIITYGLLGLSLVLGMLFSTYGFIGLPDILAKLLSLFLLTIPLFFSGFAFSSELAIRADVSAALSANLMGAMLGGFLEYNSMYFGFSSLYIFAIIMYMFAFFFSIKKA